MLVRRFGLSKGLYRLSAWRQLTVSAPPPKVPAENAPEPGNKPVKEQVKEKTSSAGHQVEETLEGARQTGKRILQQVHDMASDLGHKVVEQSKQAAQTTKEALTGKTTDLPFSTKNPPSTTQYGDPGVSPHPSPPL